MTVGTYDGRNRNMIQISEGYQGEYLQKGWEVKKMANLSFFVISFLAKFIFSAMKR